MFKKYVKKIRDVYYSSINQPSHIMFRGSKVARVSRKNIDSLTWKSLNHLFGATSPIKLTRHWMMWVETMDETWDKFMRNQKKSLDKLQTSILNSCRVSKTMLGPPNQESVLSAPKTWHIIYCSINADTIFRIPKTQGSRSSHPGSK